MTRIISGVHGGRRIHTPRGSATRPTSDRTREGLFSSLAARGWIDGAAVLDLFAGSGALGLEAISRGATSALLVDQDRGAVAAMRRTVADLGVNQVRVQARDVRAYLGGLPVPADLVFIDPPYDLAEATLSEVLARLTEGWLADGAVVVVERSSRSPEPTWPAGLAVVQSRTYGETVIWLADFVQAEVVQSEVVAPESAES